MTRLVWLLPLACGLAVSGEAQTATSTSQFSVTQAAPDLASANTYAYRVYETGGVATGVPLVMTCTGTASPFECRSPIGNWTPGSHTVTFTAISCAQPACESPRSVPLTFTMQAPSPATPGSPRIVADTIPPVPPPTSTLTPLAALTCTAANFPACGGWGPALDIQNGTQWTRRTLLPASGPHSENVVEFIQQPHPQGQYYLGWFSPSGIAVPAQGAVRYIRARIFTPNPSVATADFWGAKFIILGDGNDNTSRVICNLRDDGRTTDTLAIACSRNIDGEEHGTRIVTLPLGQWVNIQVEIRSSTTTSSNNGQLKLWVNSNAYATPTAVSPLYQQNVGNWGNINVGFYADTRASQTTALLYRIAAFEFDDEFDPAWSA